MLQAFQRSAEQRARAAQIVPSLFAECGKGFVQSHGVAGKIEINPPPVPDFVGNQKVDLRRAVQLARVKGPLVALEKDQVKRACAERFPQKFPLDSVRPHREIAGEHLLIRSRKIPAEVGACNAVLPLFQIRAGCTRADGKPCCAGLALGIDRILIDRRRASRCENQVAAGEHRTFAALADCRNARDVSAVGEYPNRTPTVENRNSVAVHRVFQCLGHVFRGQRTAGGCPCARVVVGFVAGVFAVFVAGKGNAEFHKVHETANRISRFAHGVVAVDSAAVEKRLRHFAHAVAFRTAERQFVVGLFVASRVPRSAHVPTFGQKRDVGYAERPKPLRRRKARAAASDDDGVITPFHHSRLMCIPLSTAIDCPVV